MSCKPYNNKWESQGYYLTQAPRSYEIDMTKVFYSTQGDLITSEKTQSQKSTKLFSEQCKHNQTWRVQQGHCPKTCKNKLGSDDIMNLITDVRYWN